MRARHVFAMVLTMLVIASVAGAQERSPYAPVIVSMQSKGRVRVQVSEGLTLPCDSRDNRMLFDSTLGPDEVFSTMIEGECVCVRHTSDSFPRSGWSTPMLECRPRICRGRRCWPAPDPTIRLALDGSGTRN